MTEARSPSESVSSPQGLGQAEPGTAVKRQADGGWEADPVADRDVNRPHSGSRPHYRADDFRAVPERFPSAPVGRHFGMIPDVAALGLPQRPVAGNRRSAIGEQLTHAVILAPGKERSHAGQVLSWAA